MMREPFPGIRLWSNQPNNSSSVNLLLPGSFLIKFSSLSAPTKIEEPTAGSDEKKRKHGAARRESNPGSCEFLWHALTTELRSHEARPWVRFPAGLRRVFSSDLAVSPSIFVRAEREENLINSSSVLCFADEARQGNTSCSSVVSFQSFLILSVSTIPVNSRQ